MMITIRKPDDLHVHLRETDMLSLVAPLTARHFKRALVMPNTRRPILTGADASRYREAIRLAAPELQPLMTIKLVESTTPEIIREAKAAGVTAAKFYPRGMTTNAEDGVDNILSLGSVLGEMEKSGMVLCVHGEADGFCLDREALFFKGTAEVLVRSFPKLKIVFEHVSSAIAAEFVLKASKNVAATVTAHHLVLTLDNVLGDKIRAHNFCKPIAKRPEDRRFLREMVTRGYSSRFFFGSDSAPHTVDTKECAEGCAGIFTAPVALAVLATVFEDEGWLENLGSFTSVNGANFYGLPCNTGTLNLVKHTWKVPEKYGNVVPLFAGRELGWHVQESEEFLGSDGLNL